MAAGMRSTVNAGSGGASTRAAESDGAGAAAAFFRLGARGGLAGITSASAPSCAVPASLAAASAADTADCFPLLRRITTATSASAAGSGSTPSAISDAALASFLLLPRRTGAATTTLGAGISAASAAPSAESSSTGAACFLARLAGLTATLVSGSVSTSRSEATAARGPCETSASLRAAETAARRDRRSETGAASSWAGVGGPWLPEAGSPCVYASKSALTMDLRLRS